MGEDKESGEKGGHRTQVTLALITLAGVVITALAPNWDKIFPDDKGGVTPAPAPTPTPSPVPQPIPSPSTTPDPVPTPQPAAPPVSGAQVTPNISGWWSDAEGYRYEILQRGDAYQYQQTANGVVMAYGTGQISGSSVRQTVIGAEGSGDCTGTIEPGGGAISGSCVAGGERWTFRVFRQGAG